MVVWAIASEERAEDDVRAFADALGLTMPVLWDEGGAVHDMYVTQKSVQVAPFPEEWIVGTDGIIVYNASEYDAGAVQAVIEAELAGD